MYSHRFFLIQATSRLDWFGSPAAIRLYRRDSQFRRFISDLFPINHPTLTLSGVTKWHRGGSSVLHPPRRLSVRRMMRSALHCFEVHMLWEGREGSSPEGKRPTEASLDGPTRDSASAWKTHLLSARTSRVGWARTTHTRPHFSCRFAFFLYRTHSAIRVQRVRPSALLLGKGSRRLTDAKLRNQGVRRAGGGQAHAQRTNCISCSTHKLHAHHTTLHACLFYPLTTPLVPCDQKKPMTWRAWGSAWRISTPPAL